MVFLLTAAAVPIVAVVAIVSAGRASPLESSRQLFLENFIQLRLEYVKTALPPFALFHLGNLPPRTSQTRRKHKGLVEVVDVTEAQYPAMDNPVDYHCPLAARSESIRICGFETGF
jgi:hypothetical protein